MIIICFCDIKKTENDISKEIAERLGITRMSSQAVLGDLGWNLMSKFFIPKKGTTL